MFCKMSYYSVRLLRKILYIALWPAFKCYQMLAVMFLFLANYLLDKAKSATQKAILVWLMLVSLILVAFFSYLAFYNIYVPTAEIRKPVPLSFRVCHVGVGVCSFPSGNISFWNDEGTKQEFLGAGQAYSMVITLEVPESTRNRDLGMFVVAVKLFDRNGFVTLTSERSTMLRYRSVILRLIDFAGWLPLYFFGFKEHKQTISVLMFSHLVDDYYQPSIGASVEIQSHGLEIYSCLLTLSANFTGLKYYLYYWPVASAMFAFWSNLTVFALALGITMFKRNSDIKALAVTLDLAQVKTVTKEKSKRKLSQAKMDHIDTDESKKDVAAVITSGTQTDCYNANKNEEKGNLEGLEEKESFENFHIPLVQEPNDFIPEGVEEEVGIDFVTELRQRRIN